MSIRFMGVMIEFGLGAMVKLRSLMVRSWRSTRDGGRELVRNGSLGRTLFIAHYPRIRVEHIMHSREEPLGS